jgi:phage terminase large subunit GpA-like protein
MEALELAARNAKRALIPPANIPLDQWIEDNIRLPQSISSIPGKVDLFPFQREIAQAISDPNVRRISILKPTRVGFSFLLSAAIGSFAVNSPGPALLVLPTADDAKDWATMEFDALCRESPALTGLLRESATEEGRNTQLARSFPGGSLRIVAAKSPRSLRRLTIKYLCLDEVDAYSLTTEGSAVDLALQRTLTYSDRKVIEGSTPVYKHTSNIIRSYEQSDRGAFVVQCPSCLEDFRLLWKNIEWPEAKPEDAFARCDHCKEPIAERHKPQMVARGHYHIERPEITKHRGFALNALVSTMQNMSWGALAEDFLRAKKSPDTLQTFVNCTLAEGWDESTDQIDETALQNRAEDFSLEKLPREVLMITIGTDVQRDRLESTVLGHSRDGVTYILAHVVIWGAPDDDATWKQLDQLHNTKWKHPDGGELGVDAHCADAGDGVTMDDVLKYTKHRFNRRTLAIKGVAGDRPALTMTKTAKGERLGLVGVDGIKSRLLNAVAHGSTIRFSNTLTPAYFEQLLSERRVVRYSRGVPTRVFERISGRAAEALDSFCYAQAAKTLVNMPWDVRAAELAQQPLPKPQGLRPGQVIRSAWMERGESHLLGR